MSDTRAKLDALIGKHGLMTGAQWRNDLVRVEEERADGAYDVNELIPGEAVADGDASFYLVRETFPLETPHGDCNLGDVLTADSKHVSFSANDEELAEFDPRSAVFIDTETTGLMGGAGTVAFLIGAGYFTDDAFCLEQCFMRDYDEEEPMLRFLAERFKNAETLVSYNGKSFDLPLLRTRYISNRIPFRLDAMMHYDLVHASRRFWRKRLRDCSLTNIEREVLQFNRNGDVDSSLIPQIWLDYLHSRDARKLRDVFLHHKLDILSLVTLTASLAQRLGHDDAQGFEHEEDQVSLVRVNYQQRRYDEVIRLTDTLLDRLGDDTLRRECLEMRGYAAKRTRAFEIMEHTWRRLLREFPRHMEARTELAKYCEHRRRDLVEARQLCEEGIQFLETRRTLLPHLIDAGHLQALRQRLARIERKLNRGAAFHQAHDHYDTH